MATQRLNVAVVIFGGGAAGLWLLDELHRQGTGALVLESDALGSGQTIASQGIIHGGLKYTLAGALTGSARAIRRMPGIWRRCLRGEGPVDLSRTRLRADCCHLWHTRSVRSRVGMIGARAGLRIRPVELAAAERPAALAACPGQVMRLDEQVVDPASLIEELAGRNHDRLLKIDGENGVEIAAPRPGEIESIRIAGPAGGQSTVELRPQRVVLTAGAGNGGLRERAGLAPGVMQRRPLHMVMLRGTLLPLNGHCVDGARTRVTITTGTDSRGRAVWQVGGQVAEEGTAMEPAELVRHARAEVEAVLPGNDLSAVEWSTYRVDRAEGVTRGGSRPENVTVRCDGNVVTAWPTKLALVPELARQVIALLPADGPRGRPVDPEALRDFLRPVPAQPPWESPTQWFT